MDLTAHLRAAVRNCFAHPAPSSDDKEKKESSETEQDRLGIAQSALMCLDVLARYLGSSPNWTATLADTLSEVVKFSSQVMGTIQSTDVLRLSSPTVIDVASTGANGAATPGKKNKKNKNIETIPTPSDSHVVTAGAIETAKLSFPELLKLQGSAFLSSGTMCGVVGPRALPHLGVNKFYILDFYFYFLLPTVFICFLRFLCNSF